jgi:hypothetical protein
LSIGSRFKKPWIANARRLKRNFVKKKQTKIRRGKVPFKRRCCMSFGIRRCWLLKVGRMYRHHKRKGPKLT